MSARKPHIAKACLTCGVLLERRRTASGRLEDYGCYTSRRYCSSHCAHLVAPKADAFWMRVEQAGDCWKWTGALCEGYGIFWYDREHVRAHRWAYQQLRADIPAELVLDHLCRTPACVNPWHLEPVTDAANVMRGESPPAYNVNKTHCKRGHEFTPDNTYMNGDWRRCRACDRGHASRYRARKAAA